MILASMSGSGEPASPVRNGRWPSCRRKSAAGRAGGGGNPGGVGPAAKFSQGKKERKKGGETPGREQARNARKAGTCCETLGPVRLSFVKC